jgi:hypothetical protein
MLAAAFPQDNSNTYSPVLLPLYNHFSSTLYDVCAPFTKDPYELIYIATARWPGFVRPILDEYHRLQQEARDDSGREEDQALELMPPSEDARIRLTRLFTPSFTVALEALYPRLTNASDWASDNMPRENLLSSDPHPTSMINDLKITDDNSKRSVTETLPRISKFILIAAYLASTNPQKTDMRMFGRGPDERKKKRRRGGIAEPKRGGAIKVCSCIEVFFLINPWIDSSTTAGTNAIPIRQDDFDSWGTVGRVRCRRSTSRAGIFTPWRIYGYGNPEAIRVFVCSLNFFAFRSKFVVYSSTHFRF